MSVLLLDVAVLGAGLLLGRSIVRSIRQRREAVDADLDAAQNAPSGAQSVLSGFPCKTGDVLLRCGDDDEAWLAGALVFQEESAVAALFFAPEIGGDRAVFVRKASADLDWLAPVQHTVLPAGIAEPPVILELDGVRFERVRRRPVAIARTGAAAPSVASPAILGEYQGPYAARLVVVTGGGQALAWKGVSLSPGQYEFLPGTPIE